MKDWLERSWSWHEVALATLAVTVTVPPVAGSCAGVALADRTAAVCAGRTLAEAADGPKRANPAPNINASATAEAWLAFPRVITAPNVVRRWPYRLRVACCFA